MLHSFRSCEIMYDYKLPSTQRYLQKNANKERDMEV